MTQQKRAPWTLCLAAGLLSGTAHAHEEVQAERMRMFMPAVELGVLLHADPEIAPGLISRLSLEYRFERLRAPFLRLGFDNSSPRLTQAATDTQPRFVAPMQLNDLYLGGGYRGGPWADVQGHASAYLGIQFAGVPELQGGDSALSLASSPTRSPLGIVALGADFYLDEDLLVVFELGGRASGGLDPATPTWALSATLGLTTAL